MKYLQYLIFLLFSLQVPSQNSSQFFDTADKFFSSFINNGLVEYDEIKNNPKDLEGLISLSDAVSIEDLDAPTQKAFWINVYNLIVIKSVIESYPIESPLSISGFFDKKKHTVGKEKLTLNDIENVKIRSQFNDPRVHFVLVCAGLGCPPIINKAYLPEILDMQLDKQTRLALNDSKFIRLNQRKKKVEISEIFKWYLKDFVTSQSELISYINTYRDEKIPTEYKIDYYAYDWKLNKI